MRYAIVLLAALDAADDQVVARAQAFDEARDFLGRVLQVVVEGDHELAAGARQSAQRRVLLPGVAREADQAHARIRLAQRAHHVEGAVAAGVVHGISSHAGSTASSTRRSRAYSAFGCCPDR